MPSTLRTPSVRTFSHSYENNESTAAEPQSDVSAPALHQLGAIASGDEADTDGEHRNPPLKFKDHTVNFRDFEKERSQKDYLKSPPAKSSKNARKKRKTHRENDNVKEQLFQSDGPSTSRTAGNEPIGDSKTLVPKVGFNFEEPAKRPIGKRGISNVLPAMPAMPKVLSSTVFSTANPTGLPTAGQSAPFATIHALHRSSSLPGRLNRLGDNRTAPSPNAVPYVLPVSAAHTSLDPKDSSKGTKHMSRTSAIFLLVASTVLVAICAEFLVASINYLVENTSVSEAFIGLIILPIVGNAAEHVTAVTVASKNKVDLAIGVAVGSSIQIALFVTPVIVLLGWVLHKDMSLYFSLFETISLFVSAFIINFLILDGRSNYLEGALLIAAYVIIALAAFFYPDSSHQSIVGGADSTERMLRLL